MSYYIKQETALTYTEARDKIIAALKDVGFGIITEIDMQKTLNEKIGAEIQQYGILGACNPGFAHQALLEDDQIGLLLPCNVIVQQKEGEKASVSAIDPVEQMLVTGNTAMVEVAKEVRAKLTSALATLA